MRTIGTAEIQAMKHALDELSTIVGRCAADALKAEREVRALVDAGEHDAAANHGVERFAHLRLVLVNVGARFEITVEAALGERRDAAESLADYAGRIAWAMGDYGRMRAMQRRNAMELVL